AARAPQAQASGGAFGRAKPDGPARECPEPSTSDAAMKSSWERSPFRSEVLEASVEFDWKRGGLSPRRRMVSRSPGRWRRPRYRPDRRGAVEAGIRSRKRRAAGARHHLDVEDLFHAGHELEVGHQAARVQVHGADTALQLGPPLGDRHATKRRGLA